MKKPEDCILVIFGASGDLAARKLVPALFELCRHDLLPDRLLVLGVGRTQFSDEAFREKMVQAIRSHSRPTAADAECLKRFTRMLFYQPLATTEPASYQRLRDRLTALEQQYQVRDRCIYYLATPPQLYPTIVEGLAAHGLAAETALCPFRRVVIEKPFGHDLDSARELDQILHRYFDESQILRIDHYLGKETVQNILVFRFSNGIFEPLWNRHYVHDVQILAAEDIGIENRGAYYDQAGALRDMFQNHLLQVLAFFAMEPPASFDATSVRNETVKVFDSLRPITREMVGQEVVRGQYTSGVVAGEEVVGYRDEPGVGAGSTTETYVAARVFIDNWRWGGVPFFVRTGKRMAARVTEVVVNFRDTPHHLFGQFCKLGAGRNQLVLRIQPDEGIALRFAMKVPGTSFDVRDVAMDFRYADLGAGYIPGPYERLLLDAMQGDATLYIRSDAVEACWEFVDPILQAWATDPTIPLYYYPAGSWGPAEADSLLVRYGAEWRNPCPALTDMAECERAGAEDEETAGGS
ncbi:MAG: glucose-6-phosphate dehydrogenase [Armatimonadetes bacterium]|nr:glucose-6-phosphate dehydrogenase [Armatimonadota bacterium]